MSSVRMLWTSEERSMCCATDTRTQQWRKTQTQGNLHCPARSTCGQAEENSKHPCMPCQGVLNLPGCRIRRNVPTSRFTNFIATHGLDITGLPPEPLRLTCWHRLYPWRANMASLVPPSMPQHQDGKCQARQLYSTVFFQRSYGWSKLIQLAARPFQGALRRLNPSTQLLQSSRQTLHSSHATGCVVDPLQQPFSQRSHQHIVQAKYRSVLVKKHDFFWMMAE